VSKGADGSTSGHVSVVDKNGKVIKDEDLPSQPSGSSSPPSPPSPPSPDPPADSGGSAGGGEPRRGGGEGEGRPAADSDDPYGGDGEGYCGGPRLPGGTVARILAGLHHYAEGGSGGEEDDQRHLTALQVQRIIDAAHHSGSGTDETDGVG